MSNNGPCSDYVPDTYASSKLDRDICTSCFRRGSEHKGEMNFVIALNIEGLPEAKVIALAQHLEEYINGLVYGDAPARVCTAWGYDTIKGEK